MKLTLSSEMGIHAVWYLATLDNAEPVLSADVARGISVSESYLIKVLKKLVSARILTSRKGMRKKPAQITLADIVGACEGTGDIYSCQKEDRGCLDSGRCPICITLTRASEAMYRELNATRIADLLAHGWAIPSPATMPV